MDVRIKVNPESIEKVMRLPDNFIINRVKVTADDLVLFELLDGNTDEDTGVSIKKACNLEDVGAIVNNKLKERRLSENSVVQELFDLKTSSPEISEKIDKIIELIDETEAGYAEEMNKEFEKAYNMVQKHQSKIYELQDEIVKLQDRMRGEM